MKKYGSIILAASLTVSLLMGCSPSKPDASSATTQENAATADGSQKITVWAWDPNFTIPIMENAASIYKESNPDVEFEIVEMAKADVEQKLHTTLASKMTEGLPDIVLIEDYNAQKYLQSYPGSFADLTGKIAHDDFAPYKVKVMTLDDKIYGVPFDSGVTGFFYQTDILSEAGYKAEDLQNITWDQFIEIGKAVKEKTGKALLSFDKADGGLMRTMLNSSGNWYFDEKGEPTITNNQALKEAVETYKKIMDADIIAPASGWNEWVSAFNDGNAASVTSGCWIIGSVKTAADQSGNWAVAPTPRLNYADSKNASNLGGSSIYVLENAKAKDQAIDFLNTMFGGNQKVYEDALLNQGAFSTYLPAQESPAYSAEDDFFGGQAIYTDLGNWMKEIPSIDYGLYTYEADAAIMANLDAYLSGSITVDQLLQDAEAQLIGQIQ